MNLFDKVFEGLWKNLNKLFFIPVVLVILALIFLFPTSNNVLDLGIEFTGGTEINLILDDSQKADFESLIEEMVDEDIILREVSSGENKWISLESSQEISESDLKKALEDNNIEFEGLSVRTVGSSVSSTFFSEAIRAILIAFVLMAIVIFVAFRSFIPSIAAVLSVVTDFILTVALMKLFAIPLTFGSLAALLMLIGYSIDTDVLLSARVLKTREDSIKERFKSSMRTGLTFSLASLSAFIVLALVSTSSVLDQIALVIILGLIVDIPATWLQNTYILRKYIERRDI